MSLIKKADVKSHFAARRLKELHSRGPVSQPDATGFSGEESGRKGPKTDRRVEEPLKQVSSSGVDAPPTVISPGSGDAVAPAATKSAQA
jgi:hypothetical protein